MLPDLPPEDQPRTIDIGPVKGIPVIDDDDPRFAEHRAAWSKANTKAQAAHSADELVAGMDDADWRVRHEVVDRLLARASDDQRTLPILLQHLRDDPDWQVRDRVAMALVHFAPHWETGERQPEHDQVADALLAAERDPSPEVRWAVQYSLSQFGLRPLPEGFDA